MLNVQCTVCSVASYQCAVWQCEVCSVAVYSAQNEVYSVQSTVCNVQRAVYSVQCTMFSVANCQIIPQVATLLLYPVDTASLSECQDLQSTLESLPYKKSGQFSM